jgi:hypothetical protein
LLAFEIILFSVFTVISLSVLYSTVKLGISPMPSSKKSYRVIATLIDETSVGTIVDLGSGWGNFVIRIAKQYPHRQVIGYELSLLPWLKKSNLASTRFL